MNKTKETLETTQNGQKEHKPPVAVSLSPEKPLKAFGREMEEEMIGLYHSIDCMIPESEKKAVQFIGSNEGEGTSTIIRVFAKVVSERFGKSVLLLDTDMQKTSQPNFNDFNQVSESLLFIKSYSQPGTSTIQASDFISNRDIWENVRRKFDFILVDSLPATTSSDGLAFFRKMDGVVLVIEAEKTRWQVAESVKEKIIKHGGKILGVVLNKRKHYIPGFIYKNL